MASKVERMTLPPAVAVYVNVFKARPPLQEGQDPKFQVVLLFPKATAKKALAELEAKALEVAEAQWPRKGAETLKKMRYPLVGDGDERYPEDPVFKGMAFVRASSTGQPYATNAAVDAEFPPPTPGAKNPRTGVELRALTEEELYSGCTVKAAVALFPFDKAGNRGVGLGLNAVQVVKRGTRLDGRRSAVETFEAVDEEEDLV
ncbi:MAG TPA: ssDNA-binding protein [Methylomirabilota bacterium]|nr:ssDNA-binding protein [Methylomirabilota bacterium]